MRVDATLWLSVSLSSSYLKCSPLICLSSQELYYVLIILMGGIGTVAGSLVRGIFLDAIQQYVILQLSSFAESFGWILFALSLLVIIILFPEGVVPLLSKYWKMWRTMYNSDYSGNA